MSRQSDKLFRFACVVCIFLFWGCGKEEPPPKPKIVNKKIVREKEAASSPSNTVVLKDQPKVAGVAEPSPVPVQKPVDMPKLPVSDQKKTPDTALKPFAEKTSKQPEKPADKIGDNQKSPDVPKTSSDNADKSSEKTASGISGITQKSLDKKALDLDMSGLEKDVQKTLASASGSSNTYDSKGRVDPFAPLFKEEPKKTKEAPAITRILTPLEKLDLSQLKLVGIVHSSSGTRALVEESSGKGYIIKKGTLIGIHSGKVAEILENKVIIEEEHEDYVGNEIDGWTRNIVVRKREMKLQKSPGDEL